MPRARACRLHSFFHLPFGGLGGRFFFFRLLFFWFLFGRLCFFLSFWFSWFGFARSRRFCSICIDQANYGAHGNRITFLGFERDDSAGLGGKFKRCLV